GATARRPTGDRADEHRSRPRLVPPPPAHLRHRASRARARVDRPGSARPPTGPTLTRLLLGASLCALALSGSAPGAPAIPGSWGGSYRLPATADPVPITVALHGGTATVALGPGHASAQDVKVRVDGSRVRFSLPGLPGDVAFSAVLRGQRLGGTVAQGALRGT